MNADSPIATSWAVCRREWRIRALPALMLAGSVVAVAFLWRSQLGTDGPFVAQASAFGHGQSFEKADSGALPGFSMNQPTPALLPGGELGTSARLEAPLLGGVGGGFMAPIHIQSLEVSASHEPWLFEWGARPSRLHRSASRRPELGWDTTTRARRDAEPGRRDARAPHRAFRFMAPTQVLNWEVFTFQDPEWGETPSSRDVSFDNEIGAR